MPASPATRLSSQTRPRYPMSWGFMRQYLQDRISLLRNPVTLGVRALVLDQHNRVFLVRHTYVSGWFLPGGGVDKGETIQAACVRELREEGNIEVTGNLAFHGLFFNLFGAARDHVGLFIVRDFIQTSTPKPNWEIAETGFFPLDALPEGTTRASLARIAEVLQSQPISDYW